MKDIDFEYVLPNNISAFIHQNDKNSLNCKFSVEFPSVLDTYKDLYTVTFTFKSNYGNVCETFDDLTLFSFTKLLENYTYSDIVYLAYIDFNYHNKENELRSNKCMCRFDHIVEDVTLWICTLFNTSTSTNNSDE